MEVVPADPESQEDPVYRLVAVSTPDVHAAVHGPDDASIYMDYLLVKMKELLDKNPLEALGMCDYMLK